MNKVSARTSRDEKYDIFFKVFIEFVKILLLFYVFWFFGCEACGILAPWPRIKPTPPALEGKVSTTGPPGKSPKYDVLSKNFFYLFILFLAVLGLRCCTRAFLWLRRVGATLRCGAQSSHCSGFYCGAQALRAQASVVAACGLSSCGSWALECRLSSCGARA